MTPTSVTASRGTTLGELARVLGAVGLSGDPGVVVTGVRQDSRRVEAGELFAVRGGARTSGWNYVADAIARGAVAVMAEPAAQAPLGVPILTVADVRAGIARAAHHVYGDPTRSLDVVGITGTNGKTTTSMLVCRALEANGKRPGIMGTLAYRFEELELAAPHTTPEADEIARTAKAMVERGASHLVMEISSHALAQKRADGLHVRVAAFTNLTQDHLDFHGSMEAYGAAKERLFFDFAPAASVVDIDDSFGRGLAERIAKARGAASLCTVSSQIGARADVVPFEVELGPKVTRAMVRTPAGDIAVQTNLIGAHNLANVLLCLGVSSALGLDLQRVAAALENIVVPGRLERCDGPDDDIVVLVDYAHTPDALDRVLGLLDSLRSTGRLICIFGCGGDRDPNKREPMGRAVAKWADVAVVTTDNARSEDPAAIARAIVPGLAGAGSVVVELDRARAIADAVVQAKSGDVLLIAGKGHETYQIVGDVTRHFDDREEAKRALGARRKRAGRDA
ncbi:MAG TPA: UDP-N-acetylmuramoyl-L-alanyl-D-glutamate--2,6-diaminopimelate ligase [Polyangiaceae bacterium]|nr:UDP-N-acetylmuramoyl-L-alanyl-D-glutamate--2,6-diaminopimelate ligase [Polyangiaceae bacterium]